MFCWLYIEQINNSNMINWSYGTSKWLAGHTLKSLTIENMIIWDLQMVCWPELKPFTLQGKETACNTKSMQNIFPSSRWQKTHHVNLTWPDSLVMLVGFERIAKEKAGVGAGPGRQRWRSSASNIPTPLLLLKCKAGKTSPAGGATWQNENFSCLQSILLLGISATHGWSNMLKPWDQD